MRYASWVLVAIGGLALAACNLLRLEVDEQGETTVDGAGLLGGLLGQVDLQGLDDFDITVDQALADQDVKPGDLKSVTLTRIRLTGDPDLGFLSGMDIYVSAAGIDPFLVATIDDVAPGVTEVDMTLPDEDLADAVVAGDLNFEIDASGKPPENDTLVKAFVTAEVVATAQGACNAAN